MICYDVINPSDSVTFLAPDRTIALAVLVFVGEGHYVGKPLERDGRPIDPAEDEALYVPMFWGDGSYEAWWRANGWAEEPIEQALRDRKAEIVAALRSCAYGNLEDRKTYESACAAITDASNLERFKREWEDRRRSSMNRIVQRAWAYADRIEKQEAA